MIKNKNILITGGAGFIGSNLFNQLMQQDNNITIIDNFNNYYLGKEEQLREITNKFNMSQDYNIIKGDLLDNTIFDEIKCDLDIIFHLAAQAGVRYSIVNPAEVTNNNIVSTLNIFEYAVKCNIKKVICASSSSVYGNPIYSPLDEDHPKNPISPYAISKLAGEYYADYYFRELNLPVCSLRFYTVYGPRGRPDMAIRKFFDLILKDKEITIYGDGEQIRDFTYISDILNGLILSAEKSESIGQIFNLGCSNPIKMNDLVDKMYDIANKAKKVKYIEKQQGDVEITYSNIKKASRLLGYYPKVMIDEGLKNTYEWQKNYLTLK